MLPAPEEISRDELIRLVAEREAQIAARDGQITAMAGQLWELREANEVLAGTLARLEHLLSRNSKNSSPPPSQDDDLGKTPPVSGRRGGPTRAKGKQPGAPGASLAWTQAPDERTDRFPEGRCECGHDLAEAADLGIVDCYQQHEIPQISVRATQYDQHAVRVRAGAHREPPGGGPVRDRGLGPEPAGLRRLPDGDARRSPHRAVALLASLTGAAPSVGFVHGMLARAAGLLAGAEARIRTLITLAYAVCCDETPLRVGPRKPQPGRKKAEKYLLVACTELHTHSLLADRDLDTFKAFIFPDLTDSVIVHDRYQNHDSPERGELVHQLCCAHLLRDLAGAGELYPDAHWPTQIADALRELIHQANLARAQALAASDEDTRHTLISRFRHGVLVGLSDTTSHGSRPGERKTRVPGPLHHPRAPLHRRQTHGLNQITVLHDAHRPTLDTRTPRTHLTQPTKPPTTGSHQPTGNHAIPPIGAECLLPSASYSPQCGGVVTGWRGSPTFPVKNAKLGAGDVSPMQVGVSGRPDDIGEPSRVEVYAEVLPYTVDGVSQRADLVFRRSRMSGELLERLI